MKRYLTAAFFMFAFACSAFAVSYRYEPQNVSLSGRLISADGETPDGKAIKFPALQLSQPILVEGDQDTPTEKGVLLLHLVLNQDLMSKFKELKGKSVVVKGTLFHSDNGNHQTNVLIAPSSISLRQ
jgi:hypothetical protein